METLDCLRRCGHPANLYIKHMKNLRSVTQKHYIFSKKQHESILLKKIKQKINILKIYEKKIFHLNNSEKVQKILLTCPCFVWLRTCCAVAIFDTDNLYLILWLPFPIQYKILLAEVFNKSRNDCLFHFHMNR